MKAALYLSKYARKSGSVKADTRNRDCVINVHTERKDKEGRSAEEGSPGKRAKLYQVSGSSVPSETPETTSNEDKLNGVHLEPNPLRISVPSLIIRVVCRDAEAVRDTVFFKVNNTTLMQKVMKAFATANGIDVERVGLSYDGTTVLPRDTPRTLNMQNEDIVDCFIS